MGWGQHHLPLRLPGRLADDQFDRQQFAATAIMSAAHRGRSELIEADRDPDMLIGNTEAIHRVESDPAETGHMRFRRGVRPVFRLAVDCVISRICAIS